MPKFTFASGNATKLFSLPLYALGRLACLFIRRRNTLWVFGSGAGLAEGALELLQYVRDHDSTVKPVWLARNGTDLTEAQELGITAVPRMSWRGFRATARAGVVVVTHGFGDVNRFGVHGAFVVQLWHGIPLKKIQLDSPVTFRSRLAPAWLLRAMYRRTTADIRLLPAASPLSATRLTSAFGVPRDRVVVTGDPRNDPLFRNAEHARQEVDELLGASDARLMLYAPTWRDGEPDPGVPTSDEWRAIAAWLDATGSVLALRPHPHGVGDYRAGTRFSPRIRMLDSGIRHNITPLLPGFDVLITDYSSIAFDFALTERPIVFFAPDAEDYAATRGLYEPYRQFSGGSEVATWKQVLDLLGDPNAIERLAAHSAELADRHHRYRDGRNTERVYEQIVSRLSEQGKEQA